MQKFRVIITKFLTILFTSLGFMMFFLFIYFNFLRLRLPKEIPFELTEFRFYVLIFILLIYFYVIKQLLYYKAPNDLMTKLNTVFIQPLVFFDAFIKQNKLFNNSYYKLFFYIVIKLQKSFILKDKNFLELLFQIIPRVILLAIFLIDVFMLKKLEIFYYFLLLGLIPLLYKYFKYSLEFALEQHIKLLESLYDEVTIYEKGNLKMNDMYIEENCTYKDAFGKHNPKAIYHDEIVSIREYIVIQAETRLNYDENNDDNNYIYIGRPFSKEEIYEQYRKNNNKIDMELDEEDYEKLKQVFNELETKLVSLYIYIYLKKELPDYFYIKIIKLFIYIFYFLSWSYLIIISFNSSLNLDLTVNLMQLAMKYSMLEEPFSGLFYFDLINNKILISFIKTSLEIYVTEYTFLLHSIKLSLILLGFSVLKKVIVKKNEFAKQ